MCAGFIPPAAAVGAARQYCGRCAQHRDHHTEEPITVNVDRAGLTVSGPGPGQATHVDRLVSPNNAGLDVAIPTRAPTTAEALAPYIAMNAAVADAILLGRSHEAIVMLETVVTLDHVLGMKKATRPRQANADSGDQFVRRLTQGPPHLFTLCAEVGDVKVFAALEKFVLNPPAHPATMAHVFTGFVRCGEAMEKAKKNGHRSMIEHLRKYDDVGATLAFF